MIPVDQLHRREGGGAPAKRGGGGCNPGGQTYRIGPSYPLPSIGPAPAGRRYR